MSIACILRRVTVFMCVLATLAGAAAPEGVALMVVISENYTWNGFITLIETPSMDTTIIVTEPQIIAPAAFHDFAAFSPDGKEVVFAARDGWHDGRMHIYIVDVNGNNLREVAMMNHVFWPDGDGQEHVSREVGRIAIDWAEDDYLYWSEGKASVFRAHVDTGRVDTVLTLETPENVDDRYYCADWLTECAPNLFHLQVSNDGQWFGAYGLDSVTRSEPGYLIERATGRFWYLRHNYNAISPDGSKIMRGFRQRSDWTWGSNAVVLDVASIAAGGEPTIIDTVTAFEAHPDNDHRFNMFRFSSNSNDHIVTQGEAGTLNGRAFLHCISTNEAWEIPVPEGPNPDLGFSDNGWKPNNLSDWWLGDLPLLEETSAPDVSRRVVADNRALHCGSPMRVQPGLTFRYRGDAPVVRIVDAAGRQVDAIALVPGRGMHKIRWAPSAATSACGAYWALPTSR
ncbi:MAG: hypothetical protein GF331_03230 [Chitinivibrionales bacterium]|nr:hypothetical protein [Chitinivibrionales bacterium]